MNTAGDYVVVDVETSGTNPAADRILSLAALTICRDGTIGRTLYSLLDPGVDPGPTDIHGLTTAMLTGQPRYRDVAPTLAQLLSGRILVAHNVAFDYAFLSAEARRSHTTLPVTSALCTVELSKLLRLGVGSLRLASLARHWGITQTNPHEALDDARVLAGILTHSLTRATALGIPLPVRSPSTLQLPTFAASTQRAA